MRDLGYEERKTLETDFLSLGQVERFPAAMEELVRRKVDVIVTNGQRFVPDSPLEGTGFELSVPREIGFVSN